MSWGQSRRPKIRHGAVSFPEPREGGDGDVQIRQTNLGAKLFGKVGGIWYGAPLTGTAGKPVTRIGDTLSDHLNIGSDKLEFMKDSKSMLSITSTGDINMTGKIILTSTGTQNVCIGTGQTDLGSDNIAIGVNSGAALESGGIQNVLIGTSAGDVVSTGFNNVCIGTNAGGATTTGTDNVFIGTSAGLTNIIATNSVAIGTDALKIFTGGDAGAGYSVAVGYSAGLDCTEGVQNTFLGAASGQNINTGDENTCVGYNAGAAVTTGSDNIIIGSGADGSASSSSGQIAIGKDVTCAGNNIVSIGISSNKASLGLDGSDESWSASSDERLKENITTSTAGLSFINELRPITYNWKKEKDVPSDTPHYKEGSDEPCLGFEYGKTLHGFVAQEVKTVIDNHPEIKEGFNMWQEYDNGIQAIAHGSLMPIVTKAVQELSAKIDTMQTEINNLKAGV